MTSSSSSSSTLLKGRRQSHSFIIIGLLLFSVTTTPQWCEGFVTTAPGGRHSLSLSLSPLSSSSSSLLSQRRNRHKKTTTMLSAAAKKEMEASEIKRQLTEYLSVRQQENADEKAKAEQGKVVGGTKGNKVLEYISGAPVKEQTIDRIPNIFDYDELTKYGYSYLVTPIMNLGGRRAVYDLMEMEAPPLPGPPPKIKVPKLQIDRTGETDQARYTGLKMGQVLDDDTMAEALQRANEKAKKGERLRPKLVEEEFERPFADKRNVGPQQTPDWTPEKLDEFTKQQGKAISWAKKAKMGEFVKDPNEDVLTMPFLFRLYCVFAALEISFAFGRSTSTFLGWILDTETNNNGNLSLLLSFLEPLKAVGLVLLVASIGASVACGFLLAPERNRSSFVWTVKGLIGGPLAVRQLRELEPLITEGEKQRQESAAKKRNN